MPDSSLLRAIHREILRELAKANIPDDGANLAKTETDAVPPRDDLAKDITQAVAGQLAPTQPNPHPSNVEAFLEAVEADLFDYITATTTQKQATLDAPAVTNKIKSRFYETFPNT